MGRIKKPTPGTGKRIVPTEEGRPTDNLYPIFRITDLQRDFCIRNCDQAQQAAFARALRDLSSLTWGQIKQAPRQGMGFERIYKINKKVPSQAEKETLISFRVDGLSRLIGYRSQEVFHILWIDLRGDVYDH